jgi:hypothetical protein
MASFSFMNCSINMTSAGDTRYNGSSADLANIPGDAGATITFTHEYIHFVQSISGIWGFRLLDAMIDLGIRGAVKLSPPPAPGQTGRVVIMPLLAGLADRAGQADPHLRTKANQLGDQIRCLFSGDHYAYAGAKPAWTLDTQEVTCGTFNETFWGIVTPGGRFRPITPRMCAEGMARMIDRWLARKLGFNAHTWPDSDSERELYNGIFNLLGQATYAEAVAEVVRERVAVTVCWLALATERPDLAVAYMLDFLQKGSGAGGLAKSIAISLHEALLQHPQKIYGAHHFNRTMNDIQHGAAATIDRNEYLDIYEQLKNIQNASNLALRVPYYFSDEDVDWAVVEHWMKTFTLPKVVATDGNVPEIAGVGVTPTVSDLLSQICRVMF